MKQQKYLDAFVPREKSRGKAKVFVMPSINTRSALCVLATRHCNNSKTAILFPRPSGVSVQKCTSVEDRWIYITDAVVMRPR